MSDLQFPCPQCHQTIQCDAQFAGHALQCPLCHQNITAPGAEPAPAVAAKPGRLSLGAHTPGGPPPVSTLQTGGAPLRAQKKKSNVLKNVAICAGAVVALAAGAYGIKVSGFLDQYLNKEEAAAKPAPAAKPDAPTDGTAGTTPEPSLIPVKVEVPETPAIWTLYLDTAEYPKGSPKGMLAGEQFYPQIARLDQTVLALRQGTNALEREMLVYLPIRPGEDLSGKKWIVEKGAKTGVPRVAKRWVNNPKFAPVVKFYSTGYAMMLEFGKAADGIVPGKIYLSLPDAEQSFVAGTFSVSIDPAVLAQNAAAAQAQGQGQPAVPFTTTDPEMRARYGIK
ncbi:MAG: hypothetical protein H7X97_09965 [Opitutaceae bacterium]|nr:hypothetical protein [Verrucomicrobiales bacterium]